MGDSHYLRTEYHNQRIKETPDIRGSIGYIPHNGTG